MRNYLLIINFLIASTLVSYGQEYFKVETEQGWQNTEFSVTANKPLAIAVIGYLNNNSDANNRRFNYYGPSGSVGDRADYNPMPNAPSGSLIAKIGENGEPFGIGDFKIFADGGQNPLSVSGDLYLRVNDADNNLPDNDGTFFVWIIPLINVEYYKVETTEGWQNTDFTVTANEPLSFRAIGYLNDNSDANNRRFNYYGPSGSVGDRADYNPMPNAPSGSLIAKIGENGEPFGIGDFKIFADGGQNPINESGDLYLRINDADNNLPDNDGTFFVWIMQLDNSTSVNSISASNQIHIYPNPTKTNLTVEIKNHGLNNCTIELYDNKGQIVSKNENCIVGKTLIDISKFKSGIYITKIVDEKGNIVASEKIMKE